MALFYYKAANAAGEVLEGEMEAGSQEAVIKSLQSRGHVPIRAEEIGRTQAAPHTAIKWFARRQVTREDISVFTLELSTLLQSGLALDKALEILINLAEREPARQLIADLHEKVRGGASLSLALESAENVFSHLYVNIVRAGESAGALDLALARLNEFTERSRELRESVHSALIYPIILVMVAIASLCVILGFVVPRFSQLFEDAGQALPWPTQVVVALGAFMESYWWVFLIATAGCYWLARQQLGSPATRLRWDRRFLRLPLVGDLIAKLEVARFSRTLDTLLSNGLPLPDALSIATNTVVNRAIARGLDGVNDRVRQGEGMAGSLRDARVFPRLAGELLQVGEESGELEEMLRRLATIYDREVRSTLKRLLSLVEPALILGLGLIIAGIIMSILVAILSINELGI